MDLIQFFNLFSINVGPVLEKTLFEYFIDLMIFIIELSPEKKDNTIFLYFVIMFNAKGSHKY